MKKFEYTRGVNDVNGNGYVIVPDHVNEIVFFGQEWGLMPHLETHPTHHYDTVKKDLKRELNGLLRMGYTQVEAEDFLKINNLI